MENRVARMCELKVGDRYFSCNGRFKVTEITATEIISKPLTCKARGPQGSIFYGIKCRLLVDLLPPKIVKTNKNVWL